MCEIELYRKTKIDIPLLAAGMILCILSCLMISVGIARVREDVWIAGILVAIFFVSSEQTIIRKCYQNISESPNDSFIIIFEHFSYCLYGLWACINCEFISVDKVDDNKTKSHINLFLLNEISFGYILVCRKMKKDNKRSYHVYGGYCHDCLFICRVFTNDMKRPESFQPRKRGPQHPDEALKEKLRRNSVPRGIYDNPYNPGLWRRTTTLTAPYTS
ncbi:unnamed protein product [Schistosoma intercalatum]|nr:unnamed protein product [Schistosoma intercalatum]